METVQLTMTDEVKEILQRRATKRGCSSPQEYLQSLLDEMENLAEEKRDLEALLLEGVRSPAVLADEAFWAERRRKVLERDPEFKP